MTESLSLSHNSTPLPSCGTPSSTSPCLYLHLPLLHTPAASTLLIRHASSPHQLCCLTVAQLTETTWNFADIIQLNFMCECKCPTPFTIWQPLRCQFQSWVSPAKQEWVAVLMVLHCIFLSPVGPTASATGCAAVSYPFLRVCGLCFRNYNYRGKC